MKDYTPKSGKAEFHLTYKCNLSCVNCNRMSFLSTPPTDDMTLDDAREFFRQADELNFKPNIVLIGGEPTLHPDFFEFCRITSEWLKHDPTRWFQVWSNGYTQESRDKIKYANEKYNASIPSDTHKEKSMILGQDDIFVSPADFGMKRDMCYAHGAMICGMSVDHDGYMPCSIGGMLDGALKLGLRTKRLADLFDKQKAADITEKMCANCGHNLSHELGGTELEQWRKNVTGCKKKYGSYFSKTWHEKTVGMK